MYSLLLSGAHGGVGTTTTTANLAAALQVQGFKTLSLDLNCDNALGAHFGVHVTELGGWARAALDGEDSRNSIFESHDGRCVLPFGHVAQQPDLILRRMLNEKPSIVRELIADLSGEGFDYLLIDAPATLNRSHLGIGGVGDLELLVCGPEIQSYSLLKRRRDEVLHSKAHVIMNCVQPEVPLFGDLAVLIREQFAQNTVPTAIHQDYSVPDSLAYFESVIAAAPDSQSAKDFHALALWCTSTLKAKA